MARLLMCVNAANWAADAVCDILTMCLFLLVLRKMTSNDDENDEMLRIACRDRQTGSRHARDCALTATLVSPL